MTYSPDRSPLQTPDRLGQNPRDALGFGVPRRRRTEIPVAILCLPASAVRIRKSPGRDFRNRPKGEGQVPVSAIRTRLDMEIAAASAGNQAVAAVNVSVTMFSNQRLTLF